jgi:hypothetical protein
MSLTATQREVLAIEAEWIHRVDRGGKATVIRERLGISETRYYLVLSRLIEEPEAIALEPVAPGCGAPAAGVAPSGSVSGARRVARQLTARWPGPDDSRRGPGHRFSLSAGPRRSTLPAAGDSGSADGPGLGLRPGLAGGGECFDGGGLGVGHEVAVAVDGGLDRLVPEAALDDDHVDAGVDEP